MAESFVNAQARAAGIVTTNSAGAVGVTTNIITGISTVGISSGYLVDNTNFLLGARVTRVDVSKVYVDRDSTNTAAASDLSVKFLGLTSAYTAASKSILIGGTFANNTTSQVNLTVEVFDQSGDKTVGIAHKIPVPTGSSFVISDAGKTLLEGLDEVRVYSDTAGAIDVNLSILTGVS